jgi:hypothetical protein
MNEPHPARVIPSWYGDSVGHYEGDRLVIDTVGIKIGPYAMVEWYGTPYTEALHVVERYRLLDSDAAIEAEKRSERENNRNEVSAQECRFFLMMPGEILACLLCLGDRR